MPNHDPQAPAIELAHLTFAYEGSAPQLEDVNLTVQPGEVVVLTGPSGGGKSTLTRVVNGLVPSFYEGELTGTVRLFGREVDDIPSWERGLAAGNVFQDPRSQFFANEVAGEIAFGCENYGLDHELIVERVHGAASELDIAPLLEEKVRLLSYGMRQRVAIASAKAIDPPLYVMDEPSANLDHEATEQLGNLIRALKQQGKTVLLAEHRLYYLRGIADRIVYLANGRIADSFTPAELVALDPARIEALGLRSANLEGLTAPARKRTCAAPHVPPLLEVEGLRKSFGERIVADGVSFACRPGEIVAVVGPNATGKSTLGKLLAGLVKEDGGTVRVEGKKLASGRRRGRIWYIMQDLDSQLFGESVRDELLCGQKATPERTARADEVLDALGLGALADRHPATLSGGQKQRLALGVALMHDASVIVLDEPTSGLDGKSMRSVGRQIEKLAQDVPLRDAEELLAAMR